MMHKTILSGTLLGVFTAALLSFSAVTLTLQWTIGNEEDSMLYRWVALATDDNGNVFVTDMLDCTLKKFDSRGNFIRKTGRRGQGPGEFTSPAIIRVYKDRLYVSEQQALGLHVFDLDLHYIQKIPCTLPIYDFFVIHPGSIVLTTPMNDGYCYINEKGVIGKKIRFTPTSPAQLLLNMRKIAVDGSGNKYFLSIFQDKLEKFDANDHPIWSHTLLAHPPPLRFKPTLAGMDMKVPEKMVHKGIASADGHLFVLSGQYTATPSRTILVLDEKGRLKGEWVLTEASHGIFIDQADHIYVGRNQGTSLQKYAYSIR